MKFSTVLGLGGITLVIIFAVLNWGALSTPTDLSFGITRARLPLGLLLAGLVMFLGLVFLAFLVQVRATAARDLRHHSRELRAHRELAEKAEASRLTELMARMDRMEQTLNTSIEHAGNTLAAYIGEVEELVKRQNP
jgi:hypothetical protein